MRPSSASISTCTSNHCQCSTDQFKFTNFVVILVILLAVISTSRGVLSQNVDNFRRTFVPATANCSNLTLVHFLNFFPCVHVSSSADVERCDIFAYVAAEMAVERINSDSTILPNTEVRLAPISNLVTTGDEVSYTVCMCWSFNNTYDIVQLKAQLNFSNSRELILEKKSIISSSYIHGYIRCTVAVHGMIMTLLFSIVGT